MKQAIEKAIEGGWQPKEKGWTGKWDYDIKTGLFHYWLVGITLAQTRWVEAIREDRLFWQALGKVLGWTGYQCLNCAYKHFSTMGFSECCQNWPSAKTQDRWQYEWHHFIDHLAEGKDADSFFNELLK